MKIAQVVAVYPPYRGGIGNVAEIYTNALRARGEEVDVFTPDSFVSIYRHGHAAIMPKIIRRLKEYDLIHLHYPFYGTAFFVILAAVLFRKPILVTYHMKTKATGWKGWLFRLHRWFLEPILFTLVDRILVSSDEYASAVSLTGRHVEVLPFGVDADRFSPGQNSTLRNKHDIPENHKVILFVGGLDKAHYFKGVPVLLEACAKLEADDWTLVFVGEEGDGRAHYEEQVHRLGIRDHIRFAGRVLKDELPKYYCIADLHVLPSTDRSEAFGLVTLEAAASGVMSIVSDLPGMRTLVEHGQTGWHVKPGNVNALRDKLEHALKHDDLRRVMGERARFRIESIYQNGVVLDRLQAHYKDLKMDGNYNDRI
jgi:glycosyltransferase involved in cell wall biosynthesis